MARNKYQIKVELDVVEGLKNLSEAYEEISVMKMQKVKGNVLSTREFLEELTGVYSDVKRSYKHEIDDLTKKHSLKEKILKPIQGAKNGKTLALLLTSNAKLYGEIISKIFRYFMDHVERDPNVDIAIVGKFGKELFDNRGTGRAYTYFSIPDSKVTFDDLKPIIAYILPYQTVHVYYGKFANVITQIPVETVISGEEADKQQEAQAQARELQKTKEEIQKNKFGYGFEPSLEEILYFFESQVLSSLLKQTVSETELSREASRVLAMEQALANIEKEENDLKREARRLKKSFENKKNLEALAGMSLWTK